MEAEPNQTPTTRRLIMSVRVDVLKLESRKEISPSLNERQLIQRVYSGPYLRLHERAHPTFLLRSFLTEPGEHFCHLSYKGEDHTSIVFQREVAGGVGVVPLSGLLNFLQVVCGQTLFLFVPDKNSGAPYRLRMVLGTARSSWLPDGLRRNNHSRYHQVPTGDKPDALSQNAQFSDWILNLLTQR